MLVSSVVAFYIFFQHSTVMSLQLMAGVRDGGEIPATYTNKAMNFQLSAPAKQTFDNNKIYHVCDFEIPINKFDDISTANSYPSHCCG